MRVLSLLVLSFVLLNAAFMNTADAQVRRPGPGGGYRPAPAPRPVPGPGHRPAPIPPAPRPVPTPGYGYPSPANVVCKASDRGWEEHFGGHSSCGSCLQHHGKCVETCTEVTQLCEVEGINYYGVRSVFRAVGRDRYSAEMEARRKCEWNRDMRSCHTISCRAEENVVSRRDCR